MSDLDALKKDYETHQLAAEMATSIQDFLSAYDNLMACGDLASEIGNLTLDSKESQKYADLSETCFKKANESIAHLKLSDSEIAKLKKRKTPKGFDKFIGEDKLKDHLKKDVIEPWLAHDMKSRKNSAILIYGPEGISKTVLVQSLIHELSATPYFIKPILNFSPFSENTKANFQKLFELAEEKDNVVFFFTKPTCFFPKDDDKESKATFKLFYKLFKKEMKRIRKKNLNILFVGTTSIPDKMNPKVFEKGFFDDLLRVHHPDRYTRKALMEERLKSIEFEDPEEIDKLTSMTHGYVSKEISRLCRRINSTAELYRKDGKPAIITKDMMKRIMDDLGPQDDEEFKKNVDAFESSLSKDILVTNDNHD